MKTNQRMTVSLGQFGNVSIWHKDMMGKADDIITIGNQWREEKGLKPMTLQSVLKKQDFWEFVIELNAKKVSSETDDGFIYSDYTFLKDFKKKGEVRYNDLIKMFPNLIRVQKRGKAQNIGTWVNLYLLLKIATYLSKALEVEIYDVFIKGKLLQIRDAGGNAFKALNILIDKLDDRRGKANKSCYIEMSILVRDRLDILDTRGYNDEEHVLKVQDERKEMIKNASKLIEMKMIKTYYDLKNFMTNYPL